MSITNEQLAEILVGIARTQAVILDAITDQNAKQRGLARVSALTGATRNPRPALNLQTIFAEMVIQTAAGPRPNMQPLEVRYAQELGKLIA